MALLVPGARALAHAAQRPVADGDDDAQLLGERHELVRREQPQLRMAPADERLDAGHAAAAEVDLRLVEDLDLAAAERVPQPRLEREPLMRDLVQLGRIEAEPVAAL